MFKFFTVVFADSEHSEGGSSRRLTSDNLQDQIDQSREKLADQSHPHEGRAKVILNNQPVVRGSNSNDNTVGDSHAGAIQEMETEASVRGNSGKRQREDTPRGEGIINGKQRRKLEVSFNESGLNDSNEEGNDYDSEQESVFGPNNRLSFGPKNKAG